MRTHEHNARANGYYRSHGLELNGTWLFEPASKDLRGFSAACSQSPRLFLLRNCSGSRLVPRTVPRRGREV